MPTDIDKVAAAVVAVLAVVVAAVVAVLAVVVAAVVAVLAVVVAAVVAAAVLAAVVVMAVVVAVYPSLSTGLQFKSIDLGPKCRFPGVTSITTV